MRNVFYFILLMIGSCSGSPNKVGDGSLNIKELIPEFNAEHFFKDAISDGTYKENYFVEKDSLFCYKDIGLRPFRSSLYSSDDSIFGYIYNMNSWVPKKSVAHFNSIHFSKLDVITSSQGDLVAFYASEIIEKLSHEEILRILKKECGAPLINNKDQLKTIIIWETEKNIIHYSHKEWSSVKTNKIEIEGVIKTTTDTIFNIDVLLKVINIKYKKEFFNNTY
ncbi:DUF2750 domain-containing protein [Tenacibaculum ovolyticum]|uniref:DUF2750 domain-containing protein n=1 Tax=Tenacibaculum ovolyticum TaxID=104270 RepID=UPI001F31080E|nr:DUF2750 domain-containing protein [Tenacibaculum ovolyticum]